MELKRDKNRNTTLALTFCAVLAALGTVIMLVGGVLGVATYAAPLLASCCLIPILTEYGRGRAWLAWGVTAVLSVLLCADKECAFFYVFIGYYPIIRGRFERVGRKLVRLLLKLLFFAAAVAALYAFLCFVFRLDAVLEELSETGAAMTALFFAGMLAALMVYDAALKVAWILYERRLRPRLGFLPKQLPQNGR